MSVKLQVRKYICAHAAFLKPPYFFFLPWEIGTVLMHAVLFLQKCLQVAAEKPCLPLSFKIRIHGSFFFKGKCKTSSSQEQFCPEHIVKFQSAFYCAFDLHTKNEIIYHFVIHLPTTELFLTNENIRAMCTTSYIKSQNLFLHMMSIC